MKKQLRERLRVDTFAGFFWWLTECYGRYTQDGTTNRLWLVGTKWLDGIPIPFGYEGYTFDKIEEKGFELVQIPAIKRLVTDIYPLVIIDEFQDVHERLFDIIAELAEKSRVVLLRGGGQSIYRGLKKFDPVEILKKCEMTLSPDKFLLKAEADEKQRFCQEIDTLINNYKNGVEAIASEDWPVKLRHVPRTNTRGNPNHLEILAAQELRGMKQHLNTRGSRFAVLASTNLGVAKIQMRLNDGSAAYELSPQSSSLIFGDNIFLQYGRLMLNLLKTHWITRKTEKVVPEAISLNIALLYQEQDEGNTEKPELWMPLSELLIRRAAKQEFPQEPCKWKERLRDNLFRINELLRSTRQQLNNQCPSTAFDKNDIALLKTLAMRFIGSIECNVNSDGWLNIENASRSFEKSNQQRIIFEKLGIQKNVQVMTIHKSKGREFDGVILVLEDNQKAIWKGSSPAMNEEIEDLYRVAISRARSAFTLVAFEDVYKDAADPVKRLLPREMFET